MTDAATPDTEAAPPTSMEEAMAFVDKSLNAEPEGPTDSEPRGEREPAQSETEDPRTDPADEADADEIEATDEQSDPEEAADEDADEDAETLDDDDLLDADADEPDAQLYTVTIDGKQEQITLTEALSGYQRGADYQRKTAEVAEQREAVTQQQAALTERFELADGLLSKALESLGAVEPPNPDLLDETSDSYDPQAHELQKARYEQARARIGNLVNEINASKEQVSEAEKQLMNQVRQQEAQQLRRNWPAFDKALRSGTPEGTAKAKRLLGSVKAYLVNNGFSEAQVDNLVDHRQVLIARKAMHYDRQLANGREKVKEVRNAPKMTGKKPAASQERTTAAQERRRTSRQRLRSKGTRDAAVDFVESMLGAANT